MSLTLQPHIPVLFDQPLLEKRRSFLVPSNVDCQLQCCFLDPNGATKIFDRSRYKFKARFVEGVSRRRPQADVADLDFDGDGFTLLAVPSEISAKPAIYELSLAAVSKDTNKIEYVTDYYIYLTPTVWVEENARGKGPPPYDELKIRLKDSSILENELTHHFQFQLTDICVSAICAIEDYNFTPPVVGALNETTETFPHDLFIDGISVKLFGLMIEHYRKNSLRYVASGVQIDDNKLQEYMAAYQEAYQRFKNTANVLKVQMNYMRGIGLTRGVWLRRY